MFSPGYFLREGTDPERTLIPFDSALCVLCFAERTLSDLLCKKIKFTILNGLFFFLRTPL